MYLYLSTTQKKYLDQNGPLTAAKLQRVYKKSVLDQEKTLQQAKKIKAKH